MEKDQVRLEVKSGWKIYQVITAIIGLGAIGYMVNEMIAIMEYAGEGLLFLAICFGMAAIMILYGLAYAFRHYIIFDRSGMRRKGIVNEKVIPYADISKFHFSDSFWRVSPTGKLLGNSDAILIDFKYENTEEAISFLEEVLPSGEGPEVTTD